MTVFDEPAGRSVGVERLSQKARQRLGAVVAIALACGVASAAELPEASGKDVPKVEFVAVKGRPCLHPFVKSAGATLQDYRGAEQRWLSDHYPGRPAPRWQNQLVLRPAADGVGENGGATMQTETAYVQAGDGSEITVCFEIGLDSTGSKSTGDTKP
jgi:hypothetical protein